MPPGVDVPPGWVGKASSRLARQLRKAGLGRRWKRRWPPRTPCPPMRRLTWLLALAPRRKGRVSGGIPAKFKGVLITDGYRACQGPLSPIEMCLP
jgi:hypothetical protein